ncbi:hypothetical protein QBC39DRAFT_344111 [Podospora conica]|nr:hypothetical protein QBC39DRAFT_344111 [Schizothecium conicum]
MTSPFFLACLLSVITSAVAQPQTPTVSSPSSAAAPSPTSWPAPPEPPDLVGWEVGPGPWTTARDGSSWRGKLYTPISCSSGLTFTASDIFAACCSGPCVIPKHCQALIAEADDNGTVALSSIARDTNQLHCKYLSSIPASACHTTKLYPTPYRLGTAYSYLLPTQIVGCVPESSSPPTATALYRFSETAPPLPNVNNHNNDNPLDTKHKIMIGVAVPVVIIMIGLAAVFIDRWRERGQSTRSLMRSTLDDLSTTGAAAEAPPGQALPIYEGMTKTLRSKESKPPKRPKPVADVEGVDRARRLDAAMAGPATRRGRDIAKEVGLKY